MKILVEEEDIFYKEQYLTINIKAREKTIIKGFYNFEEEKFMFNYFIRHDNSIVSGKPKLLKYLIQKKVVDLLNYYQKI